MPSDPPLWFDFTSQFISSMVGAGFGAWLAFRYADRHRRQGIADRVKEDRRIEYEKICTVAFVLMSRSLCMKNFAMDYFDPHQTQFLETHRCGQTLISPPDTRVSYYDLSPMIRSQNGDLLSKITVAETAYFNWTNSVNHRNRLSAALAESVLNVDSEEEREAALSRAEPRIRQILGLNEQFVNAWRNAHHRNSNVMAELSAAIREVYPELPAVSFVDLLPHEQY